MVPTILDAAANHSEKRAADVFCYFWRNQLCEEITYGELWKNSARYANLYSALRLSPKSVVLIALKHCPDLYYSFLGALMAGHIPSFMPFPSVKQDPVRHWESHRVLFNRISAGAIVTYDENAAILRDREKIKDLRVIETGNAACHSTVFEPVPAVRIDTAFLQHSSGTTGLKKGVQLSFGAVADQVEAYSRALGIEATDRIATWLPLYHDMGLIACFIMPLCLGISISSLDAFEWVNSPAILFNAMSLQRCTLVWLPNFAFHHLCHAVNDDCQYRLDHVKSFINCSEPCKYETFELFLRRFTSLGVRREQLQICYAMAETVFSVTQTPIGKCVSGLRVDKGRLARDGIAVAPVAPQDELYLMPVGPCIDGIEVQAIGETGLPVEEGRVGEIAVKGRFLFSGYYKNPQATRSSMHASWYRTGDMGFCLDGNLYVLGRKKELLILYGKNFYCHDIEYICNRVPGVKKGRVVAVGVYNQQLGSEELVVIAESNEQEEHWPDIKRRIKRELSAELDILPRDVKVVKPGWLLKSTAGKINRGDNAAKYLAQSAREGAKK